MTEQLWNLLTSCGLEMLLVACGSAILTEVIKRIGAGKIDRWVSALPVTFGALGMLLAEVQSLPEGWKAKAHWIVVYGSLGLFAGAVSGQAYKIIKEQFFKKLEGPAGNKPE